MFETYSNEFLMFLNKYERRFIKLAFDLGEKKQ